MAATKQTGPSSTLVKRDLNGPQANKPKVVTDGRSGEMVNKTSGQDQVQRHQLHKCAKIQELDEGSAATKEEPQKQQATPGETSALKRFTIDCLLYLIRAIITLYDLISQPIFYFKHQVYKKQQEVELIERSRQLNPADPNSPWRQVNIDPKQQREEWRINSFETYDELMQNSFKTFGDRPCYGYREVLHEQWSRRPDSEKLFRQVRLSKFNWVSFSQFDWQIEMARRGFLLEGIRSGDKVMLYAETRPEWQISSQALIRLGAIVGTMYSTLNTDGIVYSINETQVSHVVSQKDKVSKLLKLSAKLPKLKKIIYFEPVLQLAPEMGGRRIEGELANGSKRPKNGDSQDFCAQTEWPKDFEHKSVECMSFGQLLSKGQLVDKEEIGKLEEENQCKRAVRTKDSIAVIMYTSGSTGIPKGVLISHRNILATLKSFTHITKDFVYKPTENVSAAYLPLAHIFEFCIESTMLYHGVPFGFATPHTLTDKSPGLLPGQSGDLSELRPTVMIIVPLILDRIVQGVKQALREQSYFKEQLVSHLIRYKIYWQQRHYETPLVDKLVCSKIAMALGGRTKYMICGSAPLSAETQAFVRAALNIKLPQGFGTTETCASTSCQLFDDQSTSNVGVPVAGALVKLEPWLEGNYRPTDRPHPRGEIVVGGEMIAHGYFNLEELTEEAFYEDDNGVRWYRTGDIGEFLPNGNLKIIDRKKDLVKLQNGEYVSLGRIESTLKSNPFTDNFCVHANPNKNYLVAMGPANEAAIKALAQQLVDEFGRRSPPLSAKLQQQQQPLLASEDERAAAVGQLREVLALYESDRLNNNETHPNEADRNRAERKMSSLSTNSQSAGCVDERLSRLCANRLVLEHVNSHIGQLARECDLVGVEVPKRLLLLAEEWTEDKNLVTAAMKIRRNYIYKRYEKELEQLYSRPQ